MGKIVLKSVPMKRKYNNYSAIYTKAERESIISEIVNSNDELNQRKLISERLNIPPSTLRDWVRKRHMPVPRGLKRRKGGGRKPVIQHAKELQLYNWLMNARAKGAPVTVNYFLKYVKKITRQRDLRQQIHFRCTRRWLGGFFNRWNLTLRKGAMISPMSIVQGTELEKNIACLWKHCNHLREKYNITDGNVINLDEVPIWFDCAHELVIDKVAVKRARIKSNARDHMRMTLILAICGDGTKLIPLLIFKSMGKYKSVKDQIMKKYQGKLLFETSPKAYSNQEIFLRYLKKIFPSVTPKIPKLLLFDTSNTHGYLQSQMQVVGPIASFLKKRTVFIGIIPEHTTGIIQCLDTHINKSFKSQLKDEWSSFMIKNMSDVAENGLVISSLPSARIHLCRFIMRVWDRIPSALIRKSFRDNGFTLATDGSEEDQCRVYSRLF